VTRNGAKEEKGNLQNVTTSYNVYLHIQKKLCFKYAGIVILQVKVVVHVSEVNANQMATFLGVMLT